MNYGAVMFSEKDVFPSRAVTTKQKGKERKPEKRYRKFKQAI